MRRIALTLAICLITVTVLAQDNKKNVTNSILQRVSIGMQTSIVAHANFTHGPGFLQKHPENAIEANITARLWNHIGVGGYLSLMGCSPDGFSHSRTFGPGNETTLYTLGWNDNNYNLGGGAFIELHSNPFSNRNRSIINIDMVLRGGIGLGGQIEGPWVGIGEEWRVTPQLYLTIYFDYGEFKYSNLQDVTDNSQSFRSTFGMKIALK